MLDEIFIVGGGPSLKRFNWRSLSERKTIAVNAAIYDIPNPDYFITMDYTFLKKTLSKRKFFNSVDCTKVFIVGMHHTYVKEIRGAIVDTRNNRVYELHQFDVIIKSRTPHGCGFNIGDFRSGENSGFCGLQLAVLLGYKKIYLLGMDFTVKGETHYHNLYSRQCNFAAKLRLYDRNFRRGLHDIQKQTDVEVISCSPISSLNDIIPYVPMEEVL